MYKSKFIATFQYACFEVFQAQYKLEFSQDFGFTQFEKTTSPLNLDLIINGSIEGKPIYYALVHYHITLLVGMALWCSFWTGR